MTRSDRVCVLSEGEAEALSQGIPLDCGDHQHVSKEEAFSLTAPIFMQKDGSASTPVAKWVGPKQIMYTLEFVWVTVRESLIGRRVFLRITTKQMSGSVSQ